MDIPKLMTPEELEAVRARSPLEPWPANVWEGEMGGWCAVGPHRKRGDEGEDNDCFERAMDDARWIESARTDIPRLLSHIDALQAENERLRAAMREIRTAFDDYQGSEGCTCCEKSDHTVHAETMARLMKEPEA